MVILGAHLLDLDQVIVLFLGEEPSACSQRGNRPQSNRETCQGQPQKKQESDPRIAWQYHG